MNTDKRLLGLTSCFLVLLLICAFCSSATSGTIKGRVYKPLWSNYTTGHEAVLRGYAGIGVSAVKEGQLQDAGYGAAETWAGEPVGYFEIPNVVPGTYNLLFHEKDEYTRHLMFGLVVPTAFPWTLEIERVIKYQDVVTAMTWDPFPRGTWSQSFVAKGNWVTQVGVQQAIEFGPDVRVTIHEGGPSGPQIGPARMIPTVVVNASSAYWSAGEVPTVPGKTYCVNFYVPTGLQTFLAGATIQGGVAYPDGQTWRDFELSPIGPVKCTIHQDTDGIISVVNTKKTNSASLPLAYTSVRVAGQTFTAMGTSLLSCSCLVGNTGSGKMIAALYESPGVNGEGQNQVGVAKYFKAIDYNNRSGCIWKPGEVPITPGNTYYLKIKRADGQPFTIYYVNENEYSGGKFYRDGTAIDDADLSTTITTEAFPGSASMKPVRISNIQVVRGTTSAVITWTTDVPTIEDYVDWGAKTPYSSRTPAISGGTSHSATLTGLQPNQLYHYRVVSKATGKFDSYSRDFVFATNPDKPNMLTNPGFETGSISPWVAYTIYPGDFGLRNYPWTSSGDPSFFGVQARNGGGNWFYGGATNGFKNKGGLYQRVAATPGEEMCFRAWMATWQSDPVGGMFMHNSLARVGIDPTGGTDPKAPTVVWGPWNACQDIYAATEEGTGKAYWTECYVTATAVADHVTVFMEAGSEADMRWTVWGMDDAVLTSASAQIVDRIGDLGSYADGVLVRLTGKIVTGSGFEVGANYVEEPDRSCGIRVESQTDFPKGFKVTIQGRKGTKASGEPYIYNAVILAEEPSSEPGKLACTARSAKPGLLMTVAGRIKVDDQLNYYINDGSLPDPGLRIRTDPLFFLPDVGAFYAVSGIVQLEGAKPDVRTVIAPRSDDDLRAFPEPQ
ncbi:MAG: fibronectin type III domain-containing protein [Armatimonadota bacterium]|nr:fibronectin type III domain-containing protein [Armatimonadota bacterium]